MHNRIPTPGRFCPVKLFKKKTNLVDTLEYFLRNGSLRFTGLTAPDFLSFVRFIGLRAPDLISFVRFTGLRS